MDILRFMPLDRFLVNHTNLTESAIQELVKSADFPGFFVEGASFNEGLLDGIGKIYDKVRHGAQGVSAATGSAFNTETHNALNKPMLAYQKDGSWHFAVFPDLDPARPGHGEALKAFAQKLGTSGASNVTAPPVNDPMRHAATKANTTTFTMPDNNSKEQLAAILDQLGKRIDAVGKTYIKTKYVSPEELDVAKQDIAQALQLVVRQVDAAKKEDVIDMSKAAAALAQGTSNPAPSVTGQNKVPVQQAPGLANAPQLSSVPIKTGATSIAQGAQTAMATNIPSAAPAPTMAQAAPQPAVQPTVTAPRVANPTFNFAAPTRSGENITLSRTNPAAALSPNQLGEPDLQEIPDLAPGDLDLGDYNLTSAVSPQTSAEVAPPVKAPAVKKTPRKPRVSKK